MDSSLLCQCCNKFFNYREAKDEHEQRMFERSLPKPPPFQFQVLSDLHLETKQGWVKPPKKAPVLFLAGDIGDPYSEKWRKFIEYCADTWDKVFYVAGNHEYYKNDIHKVNDAIETFFAECRPEKLVLLRRWKETTYKGYRIVGCTLWSEISQSAFASMNDKNYIRDSQQGYRKLGLSKYLAEFELDSTWLRETLAEKEEPTLVLTHHCPSFKLMDARYERYGDLNTGFFSDLDELFLPHVKLWICGHTHVAKDLQLGPTRCIINPIGYTREETGFSEEAFALSE